VARLLADGTTQSTSFTYNSLNNVLSATDAMGRKTTYQYASNDIDLVGTYVQKPGGASTDPLGQPANKLATVVYGNAVQPRLPTTITNILGETTTLVYNAKGQVISAKNPKNETTTYSYYTANVTGKDRKDRLQTVDGPLTGTTDSVTYDYDSAGRLASVTDVGKGYTLSYGDKDVESVDESDLSGRDDGNNGLWDNQSTIEHQPNEGSIGENHDLYL
jgi:YD repeat-containing protein